MTISNEQKINFDEALITACNFETAKKNGSCVWIEKGNDKICIDLNSFKIICKEVDDKLTIARGY